MNGRVCVAELARTFPSLEAGDHRANSQPDDADQAETYADDEVQGCVLVLHHLAGWGRDRVELFRLLRLSALLLLYLTVCSAILDFGKLTASIEIKSTDLNG